MNTDQKSEKDPSQEIPVNTFQHCPVCQGAGKIEVACVICSGKGSVTPDDVDEDRRSILMEAASVAALTTESFQHTRSQAMREQVRLILAFMRNEARKLGANQDYVGEHRVSKIADLIGIEFRHAMDEE